MKIFDIIRMALRNLFRSKVRTTLTVLGIVIGTTAIIIMLSLGIAMNVSYQEQMSKMGSMNAITVYPNWEQQVRPKKGEEWVEPKVSQEVLDQIKLIPNVTAVSPFYSTSVKMEIGKYLGYVQVIGIEPSAMPDLNYNVSQGRLLTDDDTMQIVFGFNMKNQFYNPKSRNSYRGYGYSEEEKDFDFLEDKIQMTFDMSYGEKYPGMPVNNKKPKLYKVEGVGILEDGSWETAYQAYMNIDQLRELDQEYKDSMLSPEEKKAKKKKKEEEIGYQEAKVIVNEIKNVIEVQEQIKALGVNAYSMAEQLEQADKTQGVMQGVLGGIGAISLLVAAIGIANTMIMAIYERTREIGIMKVIGARLKDIKRMFLYEASMIGLIGGIIGIGVSYGISYLLNTVGVQFLGGMGMGMGGGETKLSIIPLWLVALGMVFSAVIGLVSGFFPARKATKLSALSAIHTE